jgi:hypothetical protein
MFLISNPDKDSLASKRCIVYCTAGDIELTSVCLPNPSENEIFLRLQHAEPWESLTGAILLLPCPVIYQGTFGQH